MSRASDPAAYGRGDLSHDEYVEELLEAQLVAQRRTAGYLAILTYVTVVILVLGVAGAVVGFVAARS